MILELVKNNIDDLVANLNSKTFKVDGNKLDCGELSQDRIHEFINLANLLKNGLPVVKGKSKPIKYKLIDMSEAEIVALYSYEESIHDDASLFAGFLEVPCIAKVLTSDSDYEAEFKKAVDSVKIKCDNKTEDMMYYTATTENTYLNVSKNILNKYPQSKLRSIMVDQLSAILARIDKCKITIGALPVLPINDPISYLYIVQGYGRVLPQLLDLDFVIPDVADYYNSTGQIGFECNNDKFLYVAGYGIVPVSDINVLSGYAAPSEVFS